jgi:hypothetical protein
MGGIPNNMTSIGQACALTAVVYFSDGTYSAEEKLTWASNSPSVARVDRLGNLVSLSRGTATISVTASDYGVSDEARLTVSYFPRYVNVHPDVWMKMADFNEGIASEGVQIYFDDTDPKLVAKAPFSERFKKFYGAAPAQVTEISSESSVIFKSGAGAGTPEIASAITPAAGLSMPAPEPAGGLIPLKAVLSLSWEEVGEILGRGGMGGMSSANGADVKDLFKKISVFLLDQNGTARPLIGASGVDAAMALDSGALSFNSGNSLSLELRFLLSDAVPGSGRGELIDGILVISDGNPDGEIAGEILMISGGSGTSGKDGENGGGCDIGAATFLLFLAAAALKKEIWLYN